MSTIQEHEQQALDAFQANVAGLAQTELDRLEAEQVQLEESLKIVRSAIRSVKATLHASLPKPSKNGSKPKKQKRNRRVPGEGFRPSEDRLTGFEQWLAKQDESADLTAAKLREAFPNWSGSYHNMVMKWGRENGYLRKSSMAGSTVIYRKLG